jgi:protein-L-isoaspartate(D-aspartate) O-methyltransferase
MPSDRPETTQDDAEIRKAIEESGYAREREWMVEWQLRGRDITDQRVLDAMRKVPRHKFMPESMRGLAYMDKPLPIGEGQTISQPYIVALMTQLAEPTTQSRALDIGTGSGYQAAVLAELVDHVYSIEILKPLANAARERLASLGYGDVEVRCGDGYRGWPEHAPFGIIIVAAAPEHVPRPLIDQLSAGGRLIIPIGECSQYLTVVEKKRDGSIDTTYVAPVAFVPMTGEARNGTRRRARHGPSRNHQ